MIEIGPHLLFLERVKSTMDNTVKFIFLSRGQVIEFSYINKNDGKDIICAPTQTACGLGCKFCFLSDYDLEVRNLKPDEILIPIGYIVNDLNLLGREGRNQVFLISFMGCGEPLCNIRNLMESCGMIRAEYKEKYRVVRFAVASLIPSPGLMQKFTALVKSKNMPLKFHLSLHSPDPVARKELMPSASSVREGVILTEFFSQHTGNSSEIHYSLIEGINDSEKDLVALIRLLKNRDIPVKFLAFNEKPSIDFKESKRIKLFRNVLELEGIKTEFYNPPGADIGSSCGQFLMGYYEKYNKKKGAKIK